MDDAQQEPELFARVVTGPSTGWMVTTHWRRVQKMMRGFGQATPKVLLREIPTELLRRRLLLNLEELLEQVRDAGFEISLDPQRTSSGAFTFDDIQLKSVRSPDIVKLLDGLADLSVTNTGFFVALGVPDAPFLEVVDANNLLKIANGKLNPETGKFEKAPDHPAPDIAGIIQKLEAERGDV